MGIRKDLFKNPWLGLTARSVGNNSRVGLRRAVGIKPIKAIAVADNAPRILNVIYINHVVVTHGDRNITALKPATCNYIGNRVGRKKRERIAQHRLVGIVAIHANPYVKEQILKRELILDVAGHINRLKGSNRIGAISSGIGRAEEICKRRIPWLQVAHVVVAKIADIGITARID